MKNRTCPNCKSRRFAQDHEPLPLFCSVECEEMYERIARDLAYNEEHDFYYPDALTHYIEKEQTAIGDSVCKFCSGKFMNDMFHPYGDYCSEWCVEFSALIKTNYTDEDLWRFHKKWAGRGYPILYKRVQTYIDRLGHDTE